MTAAVSETLSAGAVLAAVLPLAVGAAMSPLVLVLQVRQLLAPALLPPCLVLASGRRGEPMLERVGGWLNSHQRQVSAVLCFLFAALLTINGLARL
jgi:hypothetical protein